jgi:hypothetical protein
MLEHRFNYNTKDCDSQVNALCFRFYPICYTLSRVVRDYSSNICGGNDTSKAKYWCFYVLETDSKQVP